MTSQAATVGTDIAIRSGTGPLLGFRPLLAKELTEWARGKGALVIALISIPGAIFTTLIPFITPKGQGPVLSLDPTANVLLGWGGLTMAVVALLATMSLISGERDRGTLPWTLSKPVSPSSFLAAKWVAAMLVASVLGVLIPLTVSSVVATVAYGALPRLDVVATFALLYLAVPAFYIAVTIALGTVVRSTGGVAGIGFAVLLVPTLIAGAVPFLREFSPTSIDGWAMAVATGHPASAATFAAYGVAMAALVVGARMAFNRAEF
jgi:ABC-type transport system involved in multi-copper enzyme maturation permease subunit